MKNRKTLLVAVAAITTLTLTACEKKEERGVSRLPELTQAQTPAPEAAAPPDSIHQAPPLSQVAPHGIQGGSMPAGGSSGMMVQAGDTKVMAGGNILQVAGLAFTVSDSWQNVKPKNSIRVAEYQLPGEAGPADMAVYYFGKNQGGGIEDNVRRWAGQFSSADSSTTGSDAQVARMEHGDLQIALVKTHGTYNPGSMGPMGPKAEPQADYALFGLVVAGGPEGSVFIKVTGPKATLDEQNEDLEKMAQSARVSEYK